jgi:hypothetical protein
MDMTSGLENYLSINPSTGEISLTAGLDSNTEPYRYTIKVNLVFVNYDSKNVTLEQSITVNLATFAPTYTFNNSLQTTYTYGTTGSGTVSISSLPSATSVEYSLDSVDSGLSGNLSINPASGDISLTSGVVYKETPYTYKIKAQLTNINYEFRVVLSSVQNLSIVKSNALASFTMSTSNSVLTARISSGYSAFNIPLTHTYSSPPSGTTFTFQKVSGDGKAVINGSNLKVDAGLASGSYVVNVNCTASNSNYNSKTTPNIAITIKVASGNINPTNTNNYSAPKFGTDDSYHPSKPFLGTGM